MILWEYLKDRHGGVVPVQQVHLLQEVLTTKCSLTKSLTRMADTIFAKIDWAFDTAEVMKELLKSIAILSALSDKSYTHIQSIISCDLATMADVEKYGPMEIRCFLEGEQTLIDADRGSPASTTDPTPTVLAVNGLKYEKLICTGYKSRNHPNYMGHTVQWCILEGGGMEGKTIEKLRKARIAKAKEKKKTTLKFTITPTGGSAFTIEGDSNTIAAYITSQGKPTTSLKNEFTGLASDVLPSSASIEDIEDLEFDMLIVLEEEIRIILIPNIEDTQTERVYASAIIPITKLPFYLDLCATIHISPDASDFTYLKTIPDCSIRGVGGLTITATRIGSICLHTNTGATIELDNILHVPNLTVCLLSISKLAKNAGIITTFDEYGARLTNKFTKTFVASGTLLPNKDLYALDIRLDQAYTGLRCSGSADLALQIRACKLSGYNANGMHRNDQRYASSIPRQTPKM